MDRSAFRRRCRSPEDEVETVDLVESSDGSESGGAIDVVDLCGTDSGDEVAASADGPARLLDRRVPKREEEWMAGVERASSVVIVDLDNVQGCVKDVAWAQVCALVGWLASSTRWKPGTYFRVSVWG